MFHNFFFTRLQRCNSGINGDCKSPLPFAECCKALSNFILPVPDTSNGYYHWFMVRQPWPRLWGAQLGWVQATMGQPQHFVGGHTTSAYYLGGPRQHLAHIAFVAEQSCHWLRPCIGCNVLRHIQCSSCEAFFPEALHISHACPLEMAAQLMQSSGIHCRY